MHAIANRVSPAELLPDNQKNAAPANNVRDTRVEMTLNRNPTGSSSYSKKLVA